MMGLMDKVRNRGYVYAELHLNARLQPKHRWKE